MHGGPGTPQACQKENHEKNIDDKIKNSKFLKVHRSYIVNLSKVVDIEETNMVIADKVIPVSRAHKPILMNKIKTI